MVRCETNEAERNGKMKTETTLWQQFENGRAYQRAMGFPERFSEYVRFKEGEQWPAPTARTKNLPRPVFNIVEMFIRHKRAAVLNQHVVLSYTPDEAGGAQTELAVQGAKDLTDYALQLWERADQDVLNGGIAGRCGDSRDGRVALLL